MMHFLWVRRTRANGACQSTFKRHTSASIDAAISAQASSLSASAELRAASTASLAACLLRKKNATVLRQKSGLAHKGGAGDHAK